MKTIWVDIEKALIKKRNRLNSKKTWDNQRYQYLKAEGNCVNCGIRKALKPHVRCKVCFSKERNKERKRKNN